VLTFEEAQEYVVDSIVQEGTGPVFLRLVAGLSHLLQESRELSPPQGSEEAPLFQFLDQTQRLYAFQEFQAALLGALNVVTRIVLVLQAQKDPSELFFTLLQKQWEALNWAEQSGLPFAEHLRQTWWGNFDNSDTAC
jgi:hypothetical protein